jgi:hypothetical protein
MGNIFSTHALLSLSNGISNRMWADEFLRCYLLGI